MAKVEDKIVKVKCKYCRDVGIKGGCPKCGKQKDKIIETVLQKEAGIVTDDITLSKIPEYYRGKVWDKDTLIMSHKDIDGRSEFNTFVNQMNKVHEIFMNGEIPNKSAIFVAPRKFSKQIWANSCIQFGLKTGHKMLPVMSSNLLKVAMANMFERPSSSVLAEIGYNVEDIMTADCLFVSIDSGWQHTRAYSLIDELMCMRSQLDRPTIFISRFGLEDLTKGDYNKTFRDAINMDSDANRLRYPVYIQCDL